MQSQVARESSRNGLCTTVDVVVEVDVDDYVNVDVYDYVYVHVIVNEAKL